MWRVAVSAFLVLSGFSASAQDAPDDGLQRIDGDQLRAEGLERRTMLQRELRRPLAEHFDAVMAKEGSQAAADILSVAASIVVAADIEREWFAKQSPVLLVGGTTDTSELFSSGEEIEVANRLRTAMRKDTPKLIDNVLKLYEQNVRAPAPRLEAPDPPLEALVDCIVASECDGSGLVQLRKKLPASSFRDRITIPPLFITTMKTAPANRPLHPLAIQWVKDCSPQTRAAMEAEWKKVLNEDRLSSTGLELGSMAILSAMAQRDRVQLELPMFVEFLKPQYPEILRAFTLLCLNQLGSEFETLLPQVEQILRSKQESRLMRELAGSAYVSLAVDESKLNFVADTLEMRGKERAEFITSKEKEIRYEMGSTSDFKPAPRVAEGPDMSSLDVYREMLASNGISKRRMLRMIRHHGPIAAELRPEVLKLVNDKDPETRRCAKLALASLQNNSQ